MSTIIQEKREAVFRDNNTAQTFINNIYNRELFLEKEGESTQEYLKRLSEHHMKFAEIEKSHRFSNTFEIKEALHGDIDLSIFKTEKVNNITTIIFAEGEITNLLNIPEGVKKIICPNNLLISLESLPSTLEYLEIPHNHLKNIDLTKLTNLTYLNITDNEFSEIHSFPTELVELYMDNNKLKHLDLRRVPDLEVLHISNNPITIIENLPEKIRDFQMENTPTIEFRNSTILPDLKRDLNEESNINQRIDYEEALMKYFKLKNKYETNLHNAKRSTFESVNSKRSGKRKANQVRAKCINCKRPVGTIFSMQDQRYKAICGDEREPCNLKIELYRGLYDNAHTVIDEFKTDVNTAKERIIQQKLETLFSYIDENMSVNAFTQNLKEFNDASSFLKLLTDNYDTLYRNNEKNKQIEDANNKLNEIKKQVDISLKEFIETENRDALKVAVQLQKDDLYPLIEKIRRLNSECMEINKKNSTPEEFFLFKNDVALTKNDVLFGEPPRVIHFRLKT